jgi:lipopolysaccharide cholinephosphotransferase
MANYDIRPLQMRMLRVLKALDETCKAHDLRYGIFAGSLIGAVRHKGFIPWDDDMDVLMPRPDYERFIEHSRDWLPEPYEFVCAENDPNIRCPSARYRMPAPRSSSAAI